MKTQNDVVHPDRNFVINLLSKLKVGVVLINQGGISPGLF